MFKKGYIMTEEHKERIREAKTGVGFSEEHKRNLSLGQTGKPKNTKGVPRPNRYKDDVGKRAIHLWVEKWKGRPQECEMCGNTKANKYEWANVDHTYKRILEDYIRMCSPCHGKYDTSKGLRKRKGIYMSVEEFNKMLEIKNK
jgi:hypothetical protein